MSEHTPTTDDIRDSYRGTLVQIKTNIYSLMLPEEADAEFDRWLAEMKAQAWEAGYVAGDADAHTENRLDSPNPYLGDDK
jgi:hypothetical protein